MLIINHTIKNSKEPNFLRKGFLKQYYLDRFNKVKLESGGKLKNHDLTRIATLLGHLYKRGDLYEQLFERKNEEIKLDGTLVNTKDLAAFVLMDHTMHRGYFAKSAGKRAVEDTTNCQGVPLALEGAKRICKVKYSEWAKHAFDDMKELWRYDVFLPKDLGSLEYTSEGPQQIKGINGLYTYFRNGLDYSLEEVQRLRDYVPNWQTAYSPRKIEGEAHYINNYNNSGHKMRCLILRGWVWMEEVRNDDMITNLSNWDTHPKSIMFEGLKPTEKTESAYLELL